MTADVIALRAHLVAEAEHTKRGALGCQRRAEQHYENITCSPWRSAQVRADAYYETSRTATDAWLAADARLRALDGLIAASKAQEDALELRRTGTYARGRWYTREEIAALAESPCEGAVCAARECLPCGLRRMGPR